MNSATAIDIRAMTDLTPDDVPEIVNLIKELKLGFISQLPGPLIGLYYKNTQKCPDFTCRVLKDDRQILGFFVIITAGSIPRYAPFLKTPIRLFLLSTALVIPLFLFARYTVFNLKTSADQKSYRGRYDSELIYIGVKEGEKGKGLGTLLMKDMRQLLEKKDISFLGLEYFKDDQRAAGFYEKFGHEKLGELNTGGRIAVSLRIPVGNLPA